MISFLHKYGFNGQSYSDAYTWLKGKGFTFYDRTNSSTGSRRTDIYRNGDYYSTAYYDFMSERDESVLARFEDIIFEFGESVFD